MQVNTLISLYSEYACYGNCNKFAVKQQEKESRGRDGPVKSTERRKG